MTRDYASRAKAKNSRKRPRASAAVRKPRAKKTASPRSGIALNFSGQSFAAGLVLGAGLVLAMPYAVALLEESEVIEAGVPQPQEPPVISFDFEDKLKSSEVAVDTSAYPVEFETADNTGSGSTYLLQAASFHSFAEAAGLQAKLSKQQLPAMVSRVTVGETPWYRVTVGPFTRKKDAERAMTQLRENNLAPLPLTRG